MASRQAPGNDVQRYRYSITDQVQGVGFRPFVFRLASRLQLEGFVCDDKVGRAETLWRTASEDLLR